MRSSGIKRIVSACPSKHRTAIFSLLFLGLFAQFCRASDALSYTKNYFVTGDYVVGGVGLFETGVHGVATGTINISGVPQGADIVAAFLYWQTSETTASPSAANGFFDTNAIVGDPRGNPTNVACTSGSVSPPVQGRVYRADVLRFLPVSGNVRLANGPHTVQLPDAGVGGGKEQYPTTSGASLVVVYRVLTPGASLRAVVIYDGAYSMAQGGQMTQTVAGFYQATNTPTAKMTQIVSNGQRGSSSNLSVNSENIVSNPFTGAQGPRWDNPTFKIDVAAGAPSFTTKVTSSQVCLTFSSIVTSVAVQDTDGDGLLDIWETKGLHFNPGTLTQPATFGTCAQYIGDGFPCVNLPAMGANPNVKDIFIEIDWEQGSSPSAHIHAPKFPALSMIASAFAAHNIQVHFDVGNNYQTAGAKNTLPRYIVPAKYGEGGQVIQESALMCPNQQYNWTNCAFPKADYPVQGWKVGFDAVKDGFPALNIPAYFDNSRKDTFHYVLFAHAIGIPSSVIGIPSSNSGAADLPGGDVMVTFGLWTSDDPLNCDPTGINAAKACTNMTGTTFEQAGTLAHELGHNLGLKHTGLYPAPNCEPNYQSVMNYVYQSYLLEDFNGNLHVDYSNGELPQLYEESLSESNPLQGVAPPYKIAYYGPPTVVKGVQLGGSASAHCDGTPLTGDLGVRLKSTSPSSIDWNNNGVTDAGTLARDVNFNGYTGSPLYDSVQALTSGTPTEWMVDTNDWANLNLAQVGARINVGGLSDNVGQTELGTGDPVLAALGQTELGQTELGQTELGQTELGQTELGQTELGEATYEQATSSLDATSSTQPLAVDATIPCVGNPGNTVSGYLEQCKASSGLLYACNNPAGCTTSADWSQALAFSANLLTWGAPPIGQIRQYTIYRTDTNNPTPVVLSPLLTGTPPTPGFIDTVNQSSPGPAPSVPAGTNAGQTYYNTNYSYVMTATDNTPNTSAPDPLPTAPPVTGTVDHVFIQANNQTSVYGSSIPALTYTTLAGSITPPGETGTTTCITTAVKGSNAGTYPITCSGLTPATGVTYINGTLTITTKPITATLTSAPSKVYDGTTTETHPMTCSVATIISPDVVNCAATSGNFNTSQVMTANLVTATATISGSSASNYTLGAGGTTVSVTSTSVSLASSITPAPLTVTASNQTKTYGQTVSFGAGSTLFTSAGLQNSETIGSVTLAVSNNGGDPTAPVVGKTYMITPSAATGGTFTTSNYSITYAKGTLTINTAPLTVTASNQTKTYGQTVSFGAGSTLFTSSALQNSETIGSVTLAVSNTGGAANAFVGSYTITPSAATGGTFTTSNYSITYATGTLTVNTAPLTVTASPQTKTYGQTLNFGSGSTQFTSNGLQNSETIGSVTLAVSNNGGAPAAQVVGNPYTITPSAAIGGTFTASNYNIGYATGNLTITQLNASVTPNPNSKTYGTTDPAFSGTLSGFIAADGVSATYTRTAGESVAGSPYIISATLSPTAILGNYNITYHTASFAINKASASVTINPSGKTYGTSDPIPVTTGILTGFVDSVTATYTRQSGEDVGAYPIAATLSPAGVLGNYNISSNAVFFTITQAAQTITFGPLANMTYGDPDLTVTSAGATASSGLPVTFTAASGSCELTITGTVHLTNTGTCSVTASQAGNIDYTAATDVTQTFTVLTLYTGDFTLSDFTNTITTYGTFTAGYSDSANFPLPYTPDASDVNAGTRVIGNGSTLPIMVMFPTAVSKIRIFPNIDHFGAAYDGFQYSISGSNDNSTYIPLFDATTVTGSGEPFKLGTFTGTAPFSVNNVLARDAGMGPGGTVGYVADFSFGQAYLYYRFTASTEAVSSGNSDQEITAVAALP